jgi:energy-coupling factor transporter ATP-binding protein EcfA2
MQMVEHLLQSFEAAPAALHLASDAAAPPAGTISSASNAATRLAALRLPTAEELLRECRMSSQQLLPDQQRAFDHVAGKTCGLALLTGGPGSGKSYLTRRLALHFRAQGRKVLLSAFSGTASVRLSTRAGTVHGTFVVPAGQRYMRALHPAHPMRAVLEQAQVFFIDEMSMMNRDVFESVLLRLQQIHRASSIDELLQRVLIVLVGDDHQVQSITRDLDTNLYQMQNSGESARENCAVQMRRSVEAVR